MSGGEYMRMVTDAGNWIWGVVQGGFNEQQSVSQIIVDAVIGMIPVGQKVELDGPMFLSERKIQGSSMGSNRFRVDMPRYIDLYKQGRLKLDEMITKRGKLEDVNEAFRAMKAGEVARTVLMFNGA